MLRCRPPPSPRPPPTAPFQVSSSCDSTVKIWHLPFKEANRSFLELHGHMDAVWTVDGHPYETRVLSASADGRVNLWDWTNRCVGMCVGVGVEPVLPGWQCSAPLLPSGRCGDFGAAAGRLFPTARRLVADGHDSSLTVSGLTRFYS